MTAADGPARTGSGSPAAQPAADGFSAPTYHHATGHQAAREDATGRAVPDQQVAAEPGAAGPSRGRRLGADALRTAPAGTGDLTVTRAVLARSRYFSRLVAHKVISASEADGARESGLTAMIWNQVMSYAADAMVTVALAGTVFFSAPTNAQRGNVLLYLLMTMAPFAVVAPVIGPALDRVQHGRRLVMAGTAIGRAILALVMAMNFTDLYVLFPAALGSLVLSKAYAVIRSSAAPRLVPTNLTLVEANARLSLFGLAAAILGGGLVGAAIKVTGSYPFGLWITAMAFAVTAVYSFRLPQIIDALPAVAMPDAPQAGASRHPRPAEHPTLPEHTTALQQHYRSEDWSGQPRTAELPGVQPRRGRGGIGARLLAWMGRGFEPVVVVALQGESSLRWLSGFLTLFMAFYIEASSHGWEAAASLGALGAAAGIGNFTGTGIGTRLKLARPELIITLCCAVAGVGCALAALLFSVPIAIAAMFFCTLTNSLAKLSLDAIIQRDVVESLRSSAFGRSETFLQLAWVLGAAIALLLPAHQGQLGFLVATVVMLGVLAVVLLRERAIRSHRGKPVPN